MKFTQMTPTATGPADWFTGTVFIDTVQSPDQQTVIGLRTRAFRTRRPHAWHTHPQGQPCTSPTVSGG